MKPRTKIIAATCGGLLALGAIGTALDDTNPEPVAQTDNPGRFDTIEQTGRELVAGADDTAITTTSTTTSTTSSTTTLPPIEPDPAVMDELPAGPAAPQPPAATTPGGTDQAKIDSLRVAPETHADTYDRDEWGDWGGASCNVRCEVLASWKRGDGTWLSWWDGDVTSDTGDLHIDHIVSVAEAHRSGGHAWTKSKRESFYVDRDNLIPVTASSNIRKSDKDPAQWQPSYQPGVCLYVRAVVDVKWKHDLSVDQAEKNALTNLNAGCNGAHTPTTAAPAATQPPQTTTTAPQGYNGHQPGDTCADHKKRGDGPFGPGHEEHQHHRDADNDGWVCE